MVEGTCIAEENWPTKREASCDTLMMCIVTTLKEGIRNGGGIGDVLRKPSSSVSRECMLLTCGGVCYSFVKDMTLCANH